MSRRQIAFLVVKIAVAAAMLTWLFQRVDASSVWEGVRNARLAPILLGVVMALLTVVISGWRWNRLLAAIGIAIPVKALTIIAQIGQFFLVFLPGPAGDDLTRMMYIRPLAPGRVAEACSTVLLDRLIGLASVVALAAVCVPWQWSLLAASKQTYWLAVGVLVAGISIFLFGALFLVASESQVRSLSRPFKRFLPASSIGDRISELWWLLHKSKRSIFKVGVAAVLTQLILCAVFYLAGASVGIQLPWFLWLSFVPIVLASNAVPITVAGIGVREYLVVLFLGVLANVDDELALAASLITFAIILSISLLGGLVYVMYKPQQETQ